MPHNQPFRSRHRHTCRERFFHRAKQAIQQESNENGKQRQDCPRFLPLEAAPNQRKIFHLTGSLLSLPLSKWTVPEARADACGSFVTILIVLPCSSFTTSP